MKATRVNIRCNQDDTDIILSTTRTAVTLVQCKWIVVLMAMVIVSERDMSFYSYIIYDEDCFILYLLTFNIRCCHSFAMSSYISFE